jgi:serine/threonine protein kinase
MLKKLRHPGIISVHKVEETRTSLVIETEPIVCSLADALRRDARSFDVRSLRSGLFVESDSSSYLQEFDVKTGLLQVCEALVFLHSRCETALLSLSPEVVWVTRRGPWKIGGGFAFAQATKGK